jgi:hypothetical protein
LVADERRVGVEEPRLEPENEQVRDPLVVRMAADVAVGAGSAGGVAEDAEVRAARVVDDEQQHGEDADDEELFAAAGPSAAAKKFAKLERDSHTHSGLRAYSDRQGPGLR